MESLESRELLSFTTPVNYGSGSRPAGAVVADFNGDGILDLAVANYNDGAVRVLLGQGAGTFVDTGDRFPVGSYPSALVVGDFNGDGVPDLATADAGSTTVSVLLGTGDGSFRAVGRYGTGRDPESVAAADFNGDGVLDLVTANNYNFGTVSVFLGTGDGSFQGEEQYTVGPFPLAVAVGDFNGDGIPDLVTANRTSSWGSVSVLLGQGDGTFVSRGDFDGGYFASSVAVGDFNGDGVSDLVVGHETEPGTLGVFLGQGDGTFRFARDYDVGNEPGAVAVGDFNGDGAVDLVATTFASPPVAVLLGYGDGAFADALRYSAGTATVAVAVGDLNGDGAPDLAAANYFSDDISVLLNAADWAAALAGGSGRSALVAALPAVASAAARGILPPAATAAGHSPDRGAEDLRAYTAQVDEVFVAPGKESRPVGFSGLQHPAALADEWTGSLPMVLVEGDAWTG